MSQLHFNLVNYPIKDELKKYAYYNAEKRRLAELRDAIEAGKDVTSRKTFPLHATASAILHDIPTHSVLLVRHAVLRLWMFPGGHIDEGESVLDAALRETLEETGMKVQLAHDWKDRRNDPSLIIPNLLDIDTHPIPENAAKDEPPHFHADFRYLFSGNFDRTAVKLSDESNGYLWARDTDELFQHWKGPQKTVEKIAKLVRGSSEIYI